MDARAGGALAIDDDVGERGGVVRHTDQAPRVDCRCRTRTLKWLMALAGERGEESNTQTRRLTSFVLELLHDAVAQSVTANDADNGGAQAQPRRSGRRVARVAASLQRVRSVISGDAGREDRQRRPLVLPRPLHQLLQATACYGSSRDGEGIRAPLRHSPAPPASPSASCRPAWGTARQTRGSPRRRRRTRARGDPRPAAHLPPPHGVALHMG